MPKIRVEIEIEVPSCRYCVHRYGNTCKLFDRELTSYGNVGDDWGFYRCDECKQAEVKKDDTFNDYFFKKERKNEEINKNIGSNGDYCYNCYMPNGLQQDGVRHEI